MIIFNKFKSIKLYQMCMFTLSLLTRSTAELGTSSSSIPSSGKNENIDRYKKPSNFGRQNELTNYCRFRCSMWRSIFIHAACKSTHF